MNKKLLLLNSSSILIIIAALNEEQGIGLTIAEIKDILGEVPTLVVDGHSTDKTVDRSKNMGATVITQNGKGKGDAIAKAIENLDPIIDYVILTDADYTYSAENIPDMIKVLDENPNVGMVCGNRFNDNLNCNALQNIFYLGNRLIAFAHNFINGIPLKDPLTGLRVIRAHLLRGRKLKSKGFDIEVELNSIVKSSGFVIREIDIEYRDRLGQKKLKIMNGKEIFRRIVLENLR